MLVVTGLAPAGLWQSFGRPAEASAAALAEALGASAMFAVRPVGGQSTGAAIAAAVLSSVARVSATATAAAAAPAAMLGGVFNLAAAGVPSAAASLLLGGVFNIAAATFSDAAVSAQLVRVRGLTGATAVAEAAPLAAAIARVRMQSLWAMGVAQPDAAALRFVQRLIAAASRTSVFGSYPRVTLLPADIRRSHVPRF